MDQFENSNSAKPWTRLKLTELTFNSFRTALVDPTARIRAKSILPRAVPRVLGISLVGGFLHEEKIHFSDNLNCLIGGRGTGKSTAIRALAYALGEAEEFAEYDNCPDEVQVWCQDANGVLYRYDRTRYGDIAVRAKEDGSITDVPEDSFRIEYFGQGELAKVAEDPLHNPELLQDFLDRHTNLRDLLEREASILARLRENAGRLTPLEVSAAQLVEKRKLFKEIEQKLRLAQEGNLREVVARQSQLASEKAVREAVDQIAADFTQGLSLAPALKQFDQIVATAGECTKDREAMEARKALAELLAQNNAAVKDVEDKLRTQLKDCAGDLRKHTTTLRAAHQRMSAEVAKKLADLRARGLASDIPGLERLFRDKTSIAKDIATIEQRADQLREARDERIALRMELATVREEMTTRRKTQLSHINSSLGQIIRDYLVFLKYDEVGITAAFEEFLRAAMQGTWLQDDAIAAICQRTHPSQLADLISAGDTDGIVQELDVSAAWAGKLGAKLSPWPELLRLQELAKQPKPIITVRTRSTPPRDVLVKQLSDGQRHTILLTIAMLAESNVPLVIDQPEDDLDNAFIFSSVVSTLRSVKERRQVIVVTHNPNIAVLGDSELILPMYRDNNVGRAKNRGSIDSSQTRDRVMEILEGGTDAFLRRRAMYGH
jgi:DNA repair ATPase RecN